MQTVKIECKYKVDFSAFKRKSEQINQKFLSWQKQTINFSQEKLNWGFILYFPHTFFYLN